MNHLPRSARGFKRLKPLIQYALNEGWDVTLTSEGHLRFTKPGLPAIYTGFPSSEEHISLSPRHTPARLRLEERAVTRQGDHND